VNEQADQLQERAMRFAVDVCALIKLLPGYEPGPTVKHQLAKSSTSVAMNYRSSRGARSHAEFTSRIGTVADEADEVWAGWSSLIGRSCRIQPSSRDYYARGDLRNIFAASAGTARHRQRTDFRK